MICCKATVYFYDAPLLNLNPRVTDTLMQIMSLLSASYIRYSNCMFERSSVDAPLDLKVVYRMSVIMDVPLVLKGIYRLPLMIIMMDPPLDLKGVCQLP